jgi:hypothetical protein
LDSNTKSSALHLDRFRFLQATLLPPLQYFLP